MKTKSALSWFGSDAGVAPELGAMLDHCKHVTVGFVGGASILTHLKARAIVGNDKHDAAINFYRHMSESSSRNKLVRMCRQTLSHPTEMAHAQEICKRRHETVLDAWAFWACCWLGRKGTGGTNRQGLKLSYRWTANGGSNASRIKSAARNLHEWADCFEKCEWICVCFRELLPKVRDEETCGLYSDPPWVKEGGRYIHSFTEQDHRDLAKEHHRFEKTTVVVRYGDDPLIRELYPEDRWTWIEAESRTQANTTRGEVWITNRRVKA